MFGASERNDFAVSLIFEYCFETEFILKNAAADRRQTQFLGSVVSKSYRPVIPRRAVDQWRCGF
jgi:hypothetical protein